MSEIQEQERAYSEADIEAAISASYMMPPPFTPTPRVRSGLARWFRVLMTTLEEAQKARSAPK